MEHLPSTRQISRLPPLKHASHSQLPLQHKFDTLIKDISNKPTGGQHLSKPSLCKQSESSPQNSKILLRSINNTHRQGLRTKGDTNENSILNKYSLLSTKVKDLRQNNTENGTVAEEEVRQEVVKIEVTLKSTDNCESELDGSDQIDQTFQYDLNCFIQLHLATGVTLKQISPSAVRQ